MTTTKGEHAQPEALQDFEVRKLAAIGAVSTSSGLVERRPIEYRRELEDQFVRGFRAAEKRLAAQVAALTAAPQGGAYAELPASLRAMSAYPLGHCWDALDAAVCVQAAAALDALRASHGQAPAKFTPYPGCSHWGMRDTPTTAQPAPAATPRAEPLHITHGPLMRHAATLLRSRKPVLPDHESVAAELEMAADGHPTPAGDPSPEWLEVARIAMEQAPQADSQPAPSRYREKCTLGGRCLGGCLSTEPCYHADRAARATADSVTAPAGGPIAWESTTLGYTKYITQSRYEMFSPAVRAWYKPYKCSNCATPPAHAADSVLEDAALLAKIMQAIRDYHFALDNREHGGIAMARAWNAICDVLNMDWVQGAESAARKQGGA